MVAFSCCIYDGGKKEKRDMDAAREREVGRGNLRNLVELFVLELSESMEKCPLTPLEVGLMLRGMGFDKSTSIYLASGQIYDSERYMAPLFEMFPQLQTKEMLASAEELAPFQVFECVMAFFEFCHISEAAVSKKQ
ncbi:unnamed protein product [Ilex paraguariensis]|uniref:O-fucosyltransferase family protein n=1 Tax=Ilex paraguariensis TaxID=185542 RepID=A0ABC8RCJ8_9AQUA